MRKKFVYFFLLLCLVPAIVMAGSKGRIKGKITDLQTGEPLVGANVVVDGTSAGATSDVNGVFTINNVDPGTYKLRSSFIGYQSVTVEGVRVSADLTVDQNFQLPAEGITVSTVTIVAEKPLVNKDNTNAVRVTTSDDIKALPIRGVAGVISLTAGVVAQNGNVHVRGGRGDEIGYYLDGVSVTDHVAGGNGVTVSQDAVEEIQVQAGGYTAEFGGANAGIIRQQLKSGTSQLKASVEYITDNIGFKSKDKAFDGKKTLGAYSFGYDELSAVISGPVIDSRIKFFGNIDYVFRRDQSPQPFPGINLGKLAMDNGRDTIDFNYAAGPVKGNSRQDMTYTSTLNLDFNPFLIRLSGTFTKTRADILTAPDYTTPVMNMLNSRLGVDDRSNGTFNAKLTHVLNPDLFYEISGGLSFQTREIYDPILKDRYWEYGDSAANAAAGYNTSYWQGKYATPANLGLYGSFAFTAPGTPAVSYTKYSRQNYTANGAVSWNASKIHSLKFGGEFQYGVYRSWAVASANLPGSLQSKITAYKEKNGVDPTGEALDQLKATTINDAGASYYGYDVYGNKTNGTGEGKLDAPHKPIFLSGYLQDKIEYQDLVINAGLRYDYIDVDNLMLKDAAYPDNAVTKDGQLIASGWTKTPTNSYISPRLGFSFPVTEKTMFHAQYGKFIQQTKLNDIYQGYNRVAYMLRFGYFFVNPSGSYVAPTKTTQYELGFTQQLTDNISVDVLGYYKDIKDQIVFVEQSVSKVAGYSSQFSSYYTLANGDFATTKGVEINFTMRRTERLAVNGSISLQDAQGTGSFPNSNRGIVGAPLEGAGAFTPKYVSPLEFTNAIKANMNFDYRFGENDGPSWLQQFGVSLLMSYASGHPYTLGTSGAASLEDDARNRQPVEPLNSSVTPSTFRVDLRVDKSFNLFSSVKANIYVQVINLFDKKNVENVFLRTGSPDDDGYLSNPELGGKMVANNPNYAAVYKAINLDYAETFNNVAGLQFLPYMYGAPRQIRLGIRLEY